MKNRNLDHKDNWSTPKDFYEKLDQEFYFDFDPCPFQHDISLWDWLNIAWGGGNFINIMLTNNKNIHNVNVFNKLNSQLWTKSNVQNVENINQQNHLQKDQTGKNESIQDVENVVIWFLDQDNNQKEMKNSLIAKSINYIQIDWRDAQSAWLLNHLIQLIFLLTKIWNIDSIPIVENVSEKIWNRRWEQNEKILIGQIQSKIRNLNIENLLNEKNDIDYQARLGIIGVDDLFLNGLYENGKDVRYSLKINVPIVDEKNFLFKTILYLYQVIIAQEQSQEIWYQLVLNAIAQSIIKTLMIGQIINPFEELLNTSILSIQLVKNNSSIFINPPYSQKLKEAFVKKAIEESKQGRTCVMLLPVSTSTKLFHEHILPNKKEIRFIKWRLKFSWYNSKWDFVDSKCGMHDSMIVIF